ncbi:MAG: hypothetical protein BA867_08755 [Desulfobacterales bacterium S5133MH16]|jgi:hypothetical protein|nr:MAG: hypothetical protein BA867_08755 [Desulfobacterales bacterium S5133MH16]
MTEKRISNPLSIEELNLLRKILFQRYPSLLPVLASLGQVPLNFEQREDMREAIANELVETGLDEDDEPNEKGLLLENLIDHLGYL